MTVKVTIGKGGASMRGPSGQKYLDFRTVVLLSGQTSSDLAHFKLVRFEFYLRLGLLSEFSYKHFILSGCRFAPPVRYKFDFVFARTEN